MIICYSCPRFFKNTATCDKKANYRRRSFISLLNCWEAFSSILAHVSIDIHCSINICMSKSLLISLMPTPASINNEVCECLNECGVMFFSISAFFRSLFSRVSITFLNCGCPFSQEGACFKNLATRVFLYNYS
jgi:hypothetical protein